MRTSLLPCKVKKIAWFPSRFRGVTAWWLRSRGRTEVSRAEYRDGLRRLADEQAALRRVATLVAEGATPAEVFSAVAREVSQVLGVPMVTLDRYDSHAKSTVVASLDDPTFPVGSSWPLDAPSLGATIFETGRPARVDDYSGLRGPVAAAARDGGVCSAVGVPISVDGKVWGTICVGTTEGDPLSTDLPERLAGFTGLVGTAIANAEARAEIERLAEGQAALRRVATLVARGTPSGEVFAAVAEEIARVLEFEVAYIVRYEADATATVVATCGDDGLWPVDSKWTLEGDSATARVFHTRRSVRMDNCDKAAGLEHGSSVAAPILIGDRLWGAATASSRGGLPTDAEGRIAHFTDLIATAISNADTRSELTASRARVVAAADETRRRIERDLHDGIQQRLVSLALKARELETATPRPSEEIQRELSRIADGLGAALDELQKISRGIHPAVLSEAGLVPALKALARRSGAPITLDLNIDSRFEEPLEVAAYYVACEAVANAVKHARASVVELRVHCRDDALVLSFRDDGIGGADPSRGSGLLGLTDRVEALGGTITVVSPHGRGTTLHVHLPAEPGAAPTTQPVAR
jgi:signal transduction histidine kinase